VRERERESVIQMGKVRVRVLHLGIENSDSSLFTYIYALAPIIFICFHFNPTINNYTYTYLCNIFFKVPIIYLMGFIKYHFTHTHVIIRKLKHLKNKINYIISIINHIFGLGYHRYS
jgi:hypothetical protein